MIFNFEITFKLPYTCPNICLIYSFSLTQIYVPLARFSSELALYDTGLKECSFPSVADSSCFVFINVGEVLAIKLPYKEP